MQGLVGQVGKVRAYSTLRSALKTSTRRSLRLNPSTNTLHPSTFIARRLSEAVSSEGAPHLTPPNPPSASNPSKSKKAKNEVKPSARFRNSDIPFNFVRFVDPETGHLVPEPVRLRELLDDLDPKLHYLELVISEPEPIVKRVSLGENYRLFKAKKEKKRAQPKAKEKEVQLTWGVAAGDLRHKLQKVREELERGNRVDLVYVPKKGQAALSPQEMQARMKETVEILEDVSREWKPPVIEGKTAVLSFQAIHPPAPLPEKAVRAKHRNVGGGKTDSEGDA